MSRNYLEVDEVEIPNLTFFQRLRVRLFGSAPIGAYKLPDWERGTEFYVFECKDHGFQVSYAYGFGETLRCVICHGHSS